MKKQLELPKNAAFRRLRSLVVPVAKALAAAVALTAAVFTVMSSFEGKPSITVYAGSLETIADITQLGDTSIVISRKSSDDSADYQRIDLLKLLIHNDGNGPISSTDVQTPITIEVVGKNTQLLAIGEIRSNPIGIPLEASISESNTVVVEPTLLNAGDIVEIPVIGVIDSSASVTISARIRGIKQARFIDARDRIASNNKTSKSAFHWIFIACTFALTCVGFLLPAAYFQHLRDYLEDTSRISDILGPARAASDTGTSAEEIDKALHSTVHSLLRDETAPHQRERDSVFESFENGNYTALGAIDGFRHEINNSRRSLRIFIAIAYSTIVLGWVYILYSLIT